MLFVLGCIYELGDFLLYSSRLKAMTSQNFVGKGPSREILDIRENRKAMERIKDHFMTQTDLNELFEELGIKVAQKKRKSTSEGSSKPTKKRPFIIADLDEVENANKKFKPDPKAPYTYKTPPVKDPFKSKKSGRPVGSKKKRPNKNESLTSESSLDISSLEISEDGTDSDDLCELSKEDKDVGDKSKKKRVKQPYTRSSKRIKRMTESEHIESNQDEIPRNIQDENPSNIQDEIPRNIHDEIPKKIQDEIPRNIHDENPSNPDNIHDESATAKTYICNICGERSKCAQGVRAHYVVDHVWRNYEHSPIMRDSFENLSNICIVDNTGKINCACGKKCPSKINEASEDETVVEYLGRQWFQVHRLVDPAHYNPSKSQRYSDVFPEGLVLYDGYPLNEINDSNNIEKPEISNNANLADVEPADVDNEYSGDDLSLPDVEKYKKKVKFSAAKEEESITIDDSLGDADPSDVDESLPDIDMYSETETGILEDEYDDMNIDNFYSDEDENTQNTVLKFKAKKDRKKDTKSFRNLRSKAKAEAHNYKVSLKYKKDGSFTFEVKKLKNAEPYTLTFDLKEVTCNCRSFREIEERKENAANEVCKHAAMITLYCHENLRENFNGQRWFSTRSAYKRISEMLKSFDSTRNLNDKKKHPNFFLYPPPLPNPSRKFPYYKRKEYALFQLKKLEIPQWMAETYNRETNQGDKPACRSCKKKIALGCLCLRTDFTSLFINRNFKKDEFSLKTAPFRICMEVNCFNDFNNRVQPKNKYREESNLAIIGNIDLSHIFEVDKITVKNMFKNADVILVDI